MRVARVNGRLCDKGFTAAFVALAGACSLAFPALAHSAVPQVECSALQVPPGSQQQVLASRIVIDGRLMMIVGVSSKLEPKAFAQFYKTLWQGAPGKPLFVENTLGSWDIVGHKNGQCYYTVQVRAQGGGTSALLGVSALGQDFGVGVVNVPAPGGARPLTHMVSDDSGTAGDTWLLYSGNSAPAVVGWYTQTMQASGWHPDTAPGHSSTGTLLMYSKGHSHAGIVVAPFKTGATIAVTVMSR